MSFGGLERYGLVTQVGRQSWRMLDESRVFRRQPMRMSWDMGCKIGIREAYRTLEPCGIKFLAAYLEGSTLMAYGRH